MRLLVGLIIALVFVNYAAGEQPENPQADRQLLDQKLAERERLQAEIDKLRQSTGIADQVLIHVKFVEVSLTNAKLLGFDPQQFTFTAIPPAQAAGGTTAPIRSSYFTMERADVEATLKSLQEKNVAKILAEPNVVTIDGRPANYFSGGEFPYPKILPDGKQSTEFKKIGTAVDAVVHFLPNNRAELQFRATVSHADRSLDGKVNDQVVPGVQERSMDFSCIAELGKTLVVPATTQQRVEMQRKDPIPGILVGKPKTHNNVVQTFLLVTLESVPATETANRLTSALSK